jgi:hypothetical protein
MVVAVNSQSAMTAQRMKAAATLASDARVPKKI